MISVLIPTRGRPHKLLRAVASVDETAADPDDVMIVVGVDADDAETTALTPPATRCHLVWDVAPREATLGAKYNRCLHAAESDLYLSTADDMLFRENGWDRKITGLAKLFLDGAGLIFCGTDWKSSLPAHIGATHRWVELAGQWLPEHFPYWWMDTWLNELGHMTGRIVWAALDTAPMSRASDKTRGLRETPFWAEVFDRTRGQRESQADRMIDALYAGEPYRALQLRQARPQMREYFERANKPLRDPTYAKRLEAQMSEDAPADARYLRAKEAAMRFLAELNTQERAVT